MEEVHGAHKERTTGWFDTFIEAVVRIRKDAGRSRGLVVTPWSGRSPGGWSA